MALEVNIRKHLRGFDLDVQFQMDRSEGMMALLGPSGCGKSMTLKCIAGVEKPDEGRIVLDGHVLFDSKRRIDLAPQQRHVGYLFQNYALFPNMTVWQNVMAGAKGASKEERMERARHQIASMHLNGLEGQRPSELSGGQQQRCAMARILASEPELILLDEPFSALDGYLRWQIEMELSDTLRGFPGGAVFVSHNRDEVYRLCSTVCVLDRGKSDPKINVKELFERPGSLAAALISGCKNVSKAVVTSPTQLEGCPADATPLWCEDWGVALATTLEVPAGVSHVGIRAHYFEVCPGTEGKRPNNIPCAVDRVIDNTFSTIVMAKTPGGALLRYECEKDAWAALGEPTHIVLHIDPSYVMPLVGGSDSRA